jgi:hypothetical protein
MFSVPELMPSLTKKMIFFAFLFLKVGWIVSFFATPSNGLMTKLPNVKREPFLKNFLLFMMDVFIANIENVPNVQVKLSLLFCGWTCSNEKSRFHCEIGIIFVIW